MGTRRVCLMRRHQQRLGHDQCRAAFCAILVVLDLTIAYLGLISHVGRHGRMSNPIT